LQIINKVQEAILKNFSEVQDSQQFYLTGGTALSYFYLKHRQSNDLDFFTSEEEIILAFSGHLETRLKTKGFECLRQRGFHSFVELVVTFDQETTLIHLALDSAFRFEQTKTFPNFPDLRVDDLTDIASNKLLALFGRATLRDFIDVYFLINNGDFTKDQLMDRAKQKDPGFDLYWLGVAFERINSFDSNSTDIFMLIEPLSIKTLKEFFNKWRKSIADGLN
jgi:predicted nucleotidyltransferase component of viral defense system